MIMSMYAIRDVLSGFMTPVLEQSDAVAMRNFRMACDRAAGQETLMRWRPSDYQLYRIAMYNSETGAVTPVCPIELVCSGEPAERSDYA